MWRDVHRLVLQLVAAKLVCVEMKILGRGLAVSFHFLLTSLGQMLRRPHSTLVLERAGARARGSGSTRPRVHGRESSWLQLLLLVLVRKFISLF
jgi:hypothetical protein